MQQYVDHNFIFGKFNFAMSSKPTFTSKQLKSLSDEELAHHLSGWKDGTGDWHLANMEIKRRQNASTETRGWISLVISIGALLMSVFTIYRH